MHVTHRALTLDCRNRTMFQKMKRRIWKDFLAIEGLDSTVLCIWLGAPLLTVRVVVVFETLQ